MQNVEISLSMKALTWQGPARLTVLGVAALALIAYNAIAGDKILFSDEKPTTAKPNEPKSGAELFRSWNTKLDTPSFDYSILGIPTIPRAAIDRKEKRRQQNERAERLNWIIVEPGELQRKEEEKTTLGVVNRPLEDLDKNDSARPDSIFYNLGEGKKSQQRQPGEIRSGSQTPSREEQAALAAQQREREDSEADSKRERTFTLPGKEQPGAHTATELNFTGLFDPGKRDALSSADSAKSEFNLHDVFANAPARSEKQRARMDDFYKNVLYSSAPGDGGGNSLTLSHGSAASTPAFTRPADNPGSRPAGVNLFDSGASLNSGIAPGLQNRLGSPGLPTLNNSPGLPGGSPFFPQTPAQSSSRNWTSPPQEPPRRKF